MENKTFTQFVTEAKRGRPRKLKPGEQADTEHLQDQLSKLTHANHVMVHFKNGEKHEIPRAHANKALIHLSGLKPIHRADHVEHMHSSKENFYHTLSTKSVPSKKKSITLAGPKLRKEEVELDEAMSSEIPKAPGSLKGVMSLDPKERERRAKRHDRESTRFEGIYGKHYNKGNQGSPEAQKALKTSTLHSELADRYRNPEDHFENLRRRKQEFAGGGITVREEIEHLDEAGMALSANHKTAIASHIKKMWGKGKVTFDHTAGIHTVSHSEGIQTHVHSIRIKGGKAQVTHFMDMDEEVEQIDEVGNTSRGQKALKIYMSKAARHIQNYEDNDTVNDDDPDEDRKVDNRSTGYDRAYRRLKKEEVESDEKKKKDHHKLLQKFRHRIDEVKAIKGKHANKLHAAPVINPGKVGYAGKGTKPKVQSLHREDYAPLESGDKQTHVDQKTVDAKSRKQGGEKPKKPKMELTKEAWELYDSLSDAHKTIFEKMAQAERDELVDKYIKDGGQIQQVKAAKRSENSKSFPASKRAGTVFNKGAKRVHLQNKGVKGK